MPKSEIEQYIPLKFYGETFADMVVYKDGDRTLYVYRDDWSRDEALSLADFIAQNVR